MIKVSVIVPVYNVENYIKKCLDSLINQTLEDIEIIVVNDGSTDNSQQIIDEYSHQSRKIKAYRKTNGGLSDARNYGLVYATGEYIGYVDSDDFVEKDMFELLYNKAKSENSDIVECNLRHTYCNYKEDIEIGEEIYDKKFMIMHGRSVVWNKIYRREWLAKTNVIFPVGLIYEDVQYFIMLVPYIRKYSYIKDASIHYVQRVSSINNLSTLKTMDILHVLKNILQYYHKEQCYKEYEKALEYFFARILLCSSFLRMTRIANREQRKLALLENWNLLNESFPQWKENEYLKKERTGRAFFMKTINLTTYKVFSMAFSMAYQVRYIFRKTLKYSGA